MALLYYPTPGEILLCDYGSNVIAPEMAKRRPVVIVTPRLRRRGELVGVVPLSTTDPEEVMDFHCRVELERPLPPPFQSPAMWAKCDMFSVISRSRLDRFRAGRGEKRIFVAGKVSADQLQAIKAAMLCGLGLGSLTIHL